MINVVEVVVNEEEVVVVVLVNVVVVPLSSPYLVSIWSLPHKANQMKKMVNTIETTAEAMRRISMTML